MPFSQLAACLRNIVTGIAIVAAATPASALITQLDTFTIVKNGSVLFQDTFEDGTPPPSGPGEFSTYLFIRGAFGETDGKLTLNTATAPVTLGATGGSALTTRATFSTNVVNTDTVTGLKTNHTFSVSGIFSLIDGTVPSDNYGIRLTDRDPFGNFGLAGSNFGDDFIELRVTHQATGARVISFRRQNFPADTQTPIASFTISDDVFAASDQVMLTLSKDIAASNAISASFAFIANGVASPTMKFAQQTDIFHGENWTRGEFSASQAVPVPEPETYVMLLAGLGLVGWQLRRKAKRVAAQRLV